MKAIAVTTLAALGLTLVGVAAQAAPLELQQSKCTTVETITDQGYEFKLPTNDFGDYRCRLEAGDRGAGVRALQHNLRECYDASVSVTGVFDRNTVNAINDVRASFRMNETSEYDGNIAAVMNHEGRHDYLDVIECRALQDN